MATRLTYRDRRHLSDELRTSGVDGRDRGIVQRWRERVLARKTARLNSARYRRSLVRMLRLVARDAVDPNPLRRRHDVLLRYRAAAVRTELLEIAAMLDRAHDPDPSCIAALSDLLRDGSSPLYHPGVSATELRATLEYARAGLTTHP